MWGETFYSLSIKHLVGLSTISQPKKEVQKVDVKVKNGKVMQALYLGNNDVKSTSWIFYIFVPNVKDRNYMATIYCDLRYAKVEVVQGKGGDYQFTGVLNIDGFDDLYM